MSKVWLRGPVDGVVPSLQPVAHALLQAREDVAALLADVSGDALWTAPGEAASAGFHLRHLAGSLDRLFTYARGESLSDAQAAALRAEKAADTRPGAAELRAQVERALDAALAQLRATGEAELDRAREVGRKRLPSSVRGLLFHAAEHTTRHVGQAITTLRIVVPREGRPPFGLHRILVEAVRDYAIFALDAEGRVLTWNPGAERFKGYTANEIIGRHFSTFYPAEDIAAGKPEQELVVAQAEGRIEDEGWRLRKDGTRFWASVVITALRDERGQLIGYAKVTRDLTERRRAQQLALEDARRIAEVEAANRAKSEFLAAMSHELRTPLNAIAGYVDLLEAGLRGPVNEMQVADLRRIRISQKHLLAIINDLLNFSRIEAGGVSYAIEPFSLSEAIEGVRTMVDSVAAAKGIEIEWPDDAASPLVLADLGKVEQILVNLITNAVKFTASDGRITVAHASRDRVVRVTVTDTGIGIPADRLEAVFEPFVQVGRTLSSQHEGTGLGLAISRDLARAMSGDLTAASEPGRGSTFTLKLPVPGAGDGGDSLAAPEEAV